MEQFDQLRVLRWREPANSAAIVAAQIAFVAQLQLTATLLYQDPRNQQRWESVDDIRKHLLNLLDQSIGIPPTRQTVVISPRGKPLGSHYGAAYSDAELLAAFRRAVDVVRANYRQGKARRRRAWVDDIAGQLHVAPLTVKRYLRRPALREYLENARREYADT